MMMSLSAARWCIRVRKQRSKFGHFWPVHRSRRASSLVHAVAAFGQRLDFRAVAELGGLLPLADDLEIGDFFEAREHRGSCRHVVDLLPAGVVVAALHVADLQRPREVLLEKRNVFEEELLLQILGAGGDHDALARQERRNQIGERLAGAGAGLDNQVPFIAKGRLHRLGHVHLAGAVFVVWMPFRERAAAGKKPAHPGRTGLNRHECFDFSKRRPSFDVKRAERGDSCLLLRGTLPFAAAQSPDAEPRSRGENAGKTSFEVLLRFSAPVPFK